MSSRRMFSSRITTSARFLKMPISCQALYFHLGMQADDDGVVEAFTVLRTVGCTEDDLKVLDAKGFIQVLNEDLVTYIIDWNENNKIRADRIVYSQYRDLLAESFPDVPLLEKKERADAKSNIVVDIQVTDNGQTIEGQWSGNGQTTDSPRTDNGQSTDGQRTDNGRSMDGLGKDRLGKVNTGEVSLGQTSIRQERIGEERSGEESSGQTDRHPDQMDGYDNPIQIIDNRHKEPDTYELNDNECHDVVAYYHQQCQGLPKVEAVTDYTLSEIRDCVKEHGIENVDKAITEAGQSDFLNGKNKHGWYASFDWIFKPDNMRKILAGKYANRESPEGSSPPITRTATAAQ